MPAESTLVFSLVSVARSLRSRGFVQVNPGYRERLAAWGLQSPADFLDHPGEIVSGHPDRHVMRVRLGDCKNHLNAYLKREHRVPWKDRWASLRDGFGFSSVSCREAATLRLLEAHGIPAPDWIAAGEDGRGRAFLLLKAIEGTADLRLHLLKKTHYPARLRRGFARDLGQMLARMHDAGIEYPDLYAKHILVEDRTAAVTFLDWQRSRKPHRLSWRTRCRDLAALNASLADELANPLDRFAFLLAYLRASGADILRVSTICRRLEGRTQTLLRRSSVREQRLPTYRESQTLIWLDGEAICATRKGQQLFETAQLRQLAYPESSEREYCENIALTIPYGGCGSLLRRRMVRRFGRFRDWLRGRPWCSPEARAAAGLLRRERMGEPARLLAFGQRFHGGAAESFLLVRTDEAAERRSDE
jgi:tRNA A-37 threonylcarbamoyl transferase component Bud32